MEALKLLIVDDDPTLRKNLRTFFEGRNYHVETASDGVEAMDKVVSFHPHLMFLDIGLPGLSGIEVLKQAKEKEPALRVIMITGQAETEFQEEASRAGADDYVKKPFTLEYLGGEVMNKLHHQVFADYRVAADGMGIEREKFEQLFQLMKEGVLLLDSQWKIIQANPVAKGLLLLNENPLGKDLMTALEAFCYQPIPSPSHFMANPIPLSEFTWIEYVDKTFDLVRKQPDLLFIECGITHVLNTKKEPEGYLVVFRDVTDIRKTISAAHRLTNFLSHKLRTPMVALQAIPVILLDKKDANSLTDHQRRNIEVVLKNCRAIGDRVEDIIAFSSLGKEQLQPVLISIEVLIEKAKVMLTEDFPGQVDNVHLNPELANIRINADPRRMSIAFCHLLENALKFKATDVQVSAATNGNEVVIRFTDDGQGVPSQDRERIFDPFYQIDKTFVGDVPGMGLGLSVVREIVEAHDGKVRIEAGLEKGTVFVINLPPTVQTS